MNYELILLKEIHKNFLYFEKDIYNKHLLSRDKDEYIEAFKDKFMFNAGLLRSLELMNKELSEELHSILTKLFVLSLHVYDNNNKRKIKEVKEEC